MTDSVTVLLKTTIKGSETIHRSQYGVPHNYTAVTYVKGTWIQYNKSDVPGTN